MECPSKTQWRHRMLPVLGLAVLCLLGLVACDAKTTGTTEDILTQKTIEKGRTPITVLVKYAFTINQFEQAVEERFPDIDLIQVGNYTGDMGVAEYQRRLRNDDLTDVVMTWPLEAGEEYWADRLLDLSGLDFTSRYNLSTLNQMSRDGKLYYLPGPSQVRGIVYNKTLFQEKGWKVPKDYEGFLALCQAIEESGMRSIQLGFGNSEVLDTAFMGYNCANYFSKPQDAQWIAEYSQGKGSFGDHFSGALDVFQEMIDAGIWKPSDLDVRYAQREQMLFSRECAMVEDSVLLARMGGQYTGATDEFALMPFFNPSEDSDWARLYMVCFVGMNRHLAEPENKEKYEMVLELFDFISTPEGQQALAADTGAMFSSLIGADLPDVPETQDLLSALGHGRYAVFKEMKNVGPALRNGLAAMLRGEANKEEVIRMVDEANTTTKVYSPPEVLGTAQADFTLLQTGNFVTDAMRNWSGCEVALFLDNGKDGRYNGKGISGRIYAGDVTSVDISCVLPDMKLGEKGVLCRAEMTGADLRNALEHSISVGNGQEGWFYYFSGLKMTYDPKATPGERIQKLTMGDGSAFDDSKVYSVAVMDQTVREEWMRSYTPTDVTIEAILHETIQTAGTISPSGEERFLIP